MNNFFTSSRNTLFMSKPTFAFIHVAIAIDFRNYVKNCGSQLLLLLHTGAGNVSRIAMDYHRIFQLPFMACSNLDAC